MAAEQPSRRQSNEMKCLHEKSSNFPTDINSFVIGCKLGHSSFGASTILLTKRCDVEENKLYITKKIEAEKLSTKDLQILQHEMELSSKLDHANVCKFLSSFVVTDGFIFIIYPLYNYGSCHDVISTEFKHGLPIAMVSIILHSVVLGLEYLHKFGVIHRAVKASHILLDSSGAICLTGLRYSLGLSIEKTVAHNYPDHGLHMLAWIAPEIVQQNLHGYTTHSDIYSLGITAVELVTGTIPYSKLRPTEILLQKLKGVVPQLPDSATLEEMHCDLSTSQTSLDGLEQTNDMMSTPNLNNVNNKLKRIRNLQQFVDVCLQADDTLRPTASCLRSSGYMQKIKRRLKDCPSFEDLLKNINPIYEFIAKDQECSSAMELVLEKVPSVSLDDDEDEWVF